jgi:tetratricopeptide (TPR) repeat protein
MNQRNITLVEDALSCIRKNELDQAQSLLLRVLQDNPKDSEILRLLSVVAALKSDFVIALELIDKVLSLTPHNGVAYSNKGNILKQLGRHEEALRNYDRAIQLMPDYVEPYNNKANALQDLHCFEDALVWYDKAIALNPQYVEAYSNKGNALEWLRRHEEAMEYFDKATSIDPGHVDAYWQKGLSQLASGNFQLGWQNFEARWAKSNPVKFQYSGVTRLENLSNLGGKRVMVWAEQGLGDTIQFCRHSICLRPWGRNT